MEVLFTFIGIVSVLVTFSALSVALGADSRDGFAGSSFRPHFD